ncbi:MAG TPA: HNH endonuclease [Methanofastidiosum sp.]|nr:HNH endonuclease [Methanofastidiosum sp.]
MFWKKRKKTDNSKLDISNKIYKDKKGYPRFKDTGKLVHIAVKEKQLGGKVYPDGVVHHKDGNKNNFSRDNLIVMSRSEHSKLHYHEQKANEIKSKYSLFNNKKKNNLNK